MEIGVNFDGFKISDYQNRDKPIPPQHYIQDSFDIFLDNNIKIIRIPILWESYEKDPKAFMQELNFISKEADKRGIRCIYDNHQWECSSFIGYGIGFPNTIVSSLFQSNPQKYDPYKKPSKENIKKFWNNWWNRTINSKQGDDAWDVQVEFLSKIIKTLDNNPSTIAFELLNEPQVFRYSDFKKISSYYDYLLSKLTESTDKNIIFCYSYSGCITAFNLPWVQSRSKPSIEVSNEIIFDVHPYPPYHIIMFYFKWISKMMRIKTIIVGEYNAGTGDGIKINFKKQKKYLKTLKNASLYGATFWQWSYINDDGHPAFNLTKIVNGKITTTDNFANFIKAINTIEN